MPCQWLDGGEYLPELVLKIRQQITALLLELLVEGNRQLIEAVGAEGWGEPLERMDEASGGRIILLREGASNCAGVRTKSS